MTERSVEVAVALGTVPYEARIVAREHRWSADEPVEQGGGDSAPTPVEEALGALGACTAITVAMYARRKGWPLAGVSVAIVSSEDANRRRTIESRMRLAGDLTGEQRQRLLRIAEACPVHRMMSGGVVLETRLEEAAP